MRQFLDLVRENMALREKVEAGIKAANKNFVIARAGMSGEVLKSALMMPKQSGGNFRWREERHECGHPVLKQRQGPPMQMISTHTALPLRPAIWTEL